MFLLIGHDAASAQEALKWTDSTGKFEIVATFCGVKDGKVFLDNEKGKVVQVPISMLSESSRTQAKTLFLSMPTIDGSGETLRLSDDRPGAFDIRSLPEKKQANVVPRFERWSIQAAARDSSDVATLFDAFHIEIGVIGGNVKGLQVVGKLSAKTPTVSTQLNAAEEMRLYFTHVAGSEILEMKRELAAKAGIATEGRTILTFLPEKLEDVLAHLEIQYAKTKGVSSIAKIKRTNFQIKLNDGQPTLAIVDMTTMDGLASDH